MDRTSWQMQGKHAEPSWIQDIPFGPEAHVGKDQMSTAKSQPFSVKCICFWLRP